LSNASPETFAAFGSAIAMPVELPENAPENQVDEIVRLDHDVAG
jgi:hypothetical protein